VKVSDKVSEGTFILTIEVVEEQISDIIETITAPISTTTIRQAVDQTEILQPPVLKQSLEPFTKPHAGPAVRHLARDLGVDLNQVSGSGRHGRILKIDVHTYVKQVMTQSTTTTLSKGYDFNLAPLPEIDFSQFGEIETRPLNRIQKISGPHLHRSWLTIPHVTQFDESDITALEEFRHHEELLAESERHDVKVTLLPFLLKASVACLKKFPEFNASLDIQHEQLILKKYFNIGVAVDTVEGLVVPVIKNVDQRSIFELAAELSLLAQKARDKRLSPAELQGGCFTISSLGGISGTGFTPIINLPEVAILGVSHAKTQPVYQQGEWVPRLLLPLSLSYDHRVINGATAARWTHYLSFLLADVRRLLL